jgi:hypothetical protein
MKLYCWKFVKEVADHTPEQEARCIKWYEDFLNDPNKIGGYGVMRDFFTNGCVKSMGFCYEPLDEEEGKTWCKILVRGEWDLSSWYTRYVPSVDPKIIERFIEEYEIPGGDCGGGSADWFIRPAEVYTVVKYNDAHAVETA